MLAKLSAPLWATCYRESRAATSQVRSGHHNISSRRHAEQWTAPSGNGFKNERSGGVKSDEPESLRSERIRSRFQVEYAIEAVSKGTLAVGVRGKDCIVLGAEKKAAAKLQEARTVRKIVHIDDHICLAFAGLTADARVLIDKARVEAQNYRLTFDEPASVDYITKYLAQVQQRYTQGRGRRPFGISTLIVGFNAEGEPQLFQTDPSGIYSAWKANAIGRNSKMVREYLEKNYTESSGEDAIKLCVKSLMEMIEASGQTIEVMVMRQDGLTILSQDEVDAVVKQIEADTAAAEAARRTQAAGDAPVQMP